MNTIFRLNPGRTLFSQVSSIPKATTPAAAAPKQARSTRWAGAGWLVAVALPVALLVAPAVARAQTDEIQVYDGVISPQGIFNVTWHNNFTPVGRDTPAYPGAIIPNHSENGGVEFAYGVKSWFEQGLYFPIYTGYSQKRGGSLDGFKIRELFVRPHAQQHTLFYGVNFEFSFNYSYWESHTFSGEVRPIVGLYLHNWELVYNPIVDTDYTGGLSGLQYNPAGEISYSINPRWSVAAEEYDGFGPLGGFYSLHNQFHEVWAMVDHNSKMVQIEAGVGVGLTAGSDRLTLKLMITRVLNRKPIRLF